MKRAATVVLAISLAGCQRGCLATWLRDHSVGGEGPAGSGGPGAGAVLFGTDCSDGLLRCKGGLVEASRLAHLPHPCGESASPEKGAGCVCPWDVVTQCRAGCAVDGVEVIGPPDAGAEQLCRVVSDVSRPPLPSDALPIAEICNSEGIGCVDGRVRVCSSAGAAGRIDAVCIYGCEPAVSLPPGEALVTDGVAQILCRRAHAERR